MRCRPREWQTRALQPSGCPAWSWEAYSGRCWPAASPTPSSRATPRAETAASVSRCLQKHLILCASYKDWIPWRQHGIPRGHSGCMDQHSSVQGLVTMRKASCSLGAEQAGRCRSSWRTLWALLRAWLPSTSRPHHGPSCSGQQSSSLGSSSMAHRCSSVSVVLSW